MIIEKGIPAPESSGSKKYPFVDLAVGDSVFIDGAKFKGKEYCAAKAAARYKGFKIRAKSENGGIRIWRVE